MWIVIVVINRFQGLQDGDYATSVWRNMPGFSFQR